jgi:transcriptional regulator with XRE-family HTH domain
VFGRRLRELRHKHGVTTALVDAAGLTKAHIRNIENGFAVASISQIVFCALS